MTITTTACRATLLYRAREGPADKAEQQMRLVIVRHGETAWERADRYTGITDVGLTTMRIEPLVAECDYGEYAGLTAEQIDQLAPGWELWRDGCPHRESTPDVVQRADAFLHAHAENGTQPVVVITHGRTRVLVAGPRPLKSAPGLRFCSSCRCPSMTAPASVARRCENKVAVTAQNMGWDDSRSLTGETAATDLTDIGCRYLSLGHSERCPLPGRDERHDRAQAPDVVRGPANADLVRRRHPRRTPRRLLAAAAGRGALTVTVRRPAGTGRTVDLPAAWKEMFAGNPKTQAEKDHATFVALDEVADYDTSVDGKSRSDGSHSLLQSRAVDLPTGAPDDYVQAVLSAGLRKAVVADLARLIDQVDPA